MNAERIAELMELVKEMNKLYPLDYPVLELLEINTQQRAAARTALPELLEEIERLKRERLSMIADITVLEAKLEKSIKRSEEFFRKLNE